MNSKITHIVLDFGGVVAPVDMAGCLERYHALGFKTVDRYLNLVRQEAFFGDFESGKIDGKELSRIISREAGCNISEEECRYAFLGFFSTIRQDELDRNLAAIRELRERGYRLALLSNTNPFIASWFLSESFDGHGHPLSDYFDSLYLSYRLGIMKPDEQIFRIMLEGERTAPEQVLFVDDGASNIAAASRLGMHTLLAAAGTDWTEEILKKI